MTTKDGLLLKAAREAVSSALEKKAYSNPELEKAFPKKSGVFVQLYMKGELRGSVGFPEPVHPIARAVVMAAKAAAFEDPRFTRLKQDELKGVKFEVSILSTPGEIKAAKSALIKKVKPGKNGYMIRLGPSEGVLLPGETDGMSPEELLEDLCEKAGLSTEMWKDSNAKVYEFRVETYSEQFK